jgi:hypothetical protein
MWAQSSHNPKRFFVVIEIIVRTVFATRGIRMFHANPLISKIRIVKKNRNTGTII